MSLNDIAVSDLADINKDDGASGFGCPLSITSPLGDVFNVIGRKRDIHMVTDSNTGEMISGRRATASVTTSDISERIIGVHEGAPWLLSYNDLNGNEQIFKIEDSFPDNTLGLTTLILVSWTPNADN